jgi:hypothetical protein
MAAQLDLEFLMLPHDYFIEGGIHPINPWWPYGGWL